ncbi:MAG TPA: hypothetical protein GX392_04125 [Clostridiales bacterium]|nr:hypothetical protein [Clostridiales bacterium]
MNELVLETLKIMGKGMGTVFFVLFIFYIMVKILTKIFPHDEPTE